MRLVLATGNPGKLRELETLLAPWHVEVLPQSLFTASVAEETGSSFAENAILKARHAAQASGLPAIADDSGLEVDALQGAPGVHSARYAGPDATDEDNRRKLLHAMETVADDNRQARYRCALVYMKFPTDASPIIAQASWEGTLIRAPRGTGGFGYDSIFAVDGSGLTAAELPTGEKNRLSHRGLALRALIAQMVVAGELRSRR